MRTVLVDSGAFLALQDAADDDHGNARDVLLALERERTSLFATNFIRCEAYTLIGARQSWEAARAWLREFDVPIERVTAEDEERAIAILLRYKDKSFSFVDATSFAVMERLGVQDAFTLDDHFRQYGFNALGL